MRGGSICPPPLFGHSKVNCFEKFSLKCSQNVLKEHFSIARTFVIFHSHKPTGNINTLYKSAPTLAGKKAT